VGWRQINGKVILPLFEMNLLFEELERRIHANDITHTKTLAH
jgi:hypothetical protein